MDHNLTSHSSQKIKSRNCPFCAKKSSSVILYLQYKNIFPLNYTFKPDWFTPDTIPDDIPFSIVRCSNCQFVYSDYTLSPDLQYSFYHDAIDAQLSREKIYKKPKRTQLLEIWIQLHKLYDYQDQNLKVLDFGAGWGDFLAIAKCPGIDVFGLEYDTRKIEFANINQVPSGDVEFVQNNAPFDIFMCNQVLEHLENPREALSTLRGLLKTGATGYISVPDFSDERLKSEIKIIENGGTPTKDLDPFGHLNYFNPKNIREMVFTAGFEEITKQRDQIPKRRSFIWNKEKSEKPYIGTSIFVRAV